MRVLWVSCLLIGSITCGPVEIEYGPNRADPSSMRQPLSSTYWFSGGGVSSDPGSSSLVPSLPYPSPGRATEPLAPQDALSSAGPGSYSSYPALYSSTNTAGGNGFDSSYPRLGDEGYNSPEVSPYGPAYAPSGSTGYGSYDAYVGDSSYGSVVAPRDESSGPGYGDENPEPVFSDVSDLEPVYAFRSRSSYQRGRAVFAQTRYSPGAPAPPVWSGSISKTPSKQSSPPKAPTKGGF